MRNTFLELNSLTDRHYDFCYLGIECCSADYLLGVEKGADKVRELSFRYANADGTALPLKVYSPERGYILKDVTACDYGNVSASSLEELGRELEKVNLQTGCIPVFVGGDHSVTYELVKKVSNDYDGIVVVQFDAHSDYIDEYSDYPHGSVMKETSKLEKVERIIHFGIRGNLNCQPAIDQSRSEGNMVVPYCEIKERLEKVLYYLKGKKVYITFDTDFMNPAIAPATNCPEPGGPFYEETLNYLKSIIEASGKIVGLDFVEYNPTCEGASVTGITIVNLIMECMHFIKSNTTS